MKDKDMAGKDGELRGILRDETNDTYLNARVAFTCGKIYIHIDGYGDACSLDGEGEPIVVDFYNKKLQVLIWSDINKQDPTHVIDLAEAKEKNRKA